jgi:hypothetical protein
MAEMKKKEVSESVAAAEVAMEAKVAEVTATKDAEVAAHKAAADKEKNKRERQSQLWREHMEKMDAMEAE